MVVSIRNWPQSKSQGYQGIVISSLVATTLVLCGCDPVQPHLPGVQGAYTGPGERLSVLGDDEEHSFPRLFAFANGGDLIVTTFGSSSCPDVPEVLAVDDSEGTVVLSLTILGADGECTADSSERTFRFEGVGDLGTYTVQITDR